MFRPVGCMKVWSSGILCQLLYLSSTVIVRSALGGLCWERIEHVTGTCRGSLLGNMTFESCCSTSRVATVAWSPHVSSSDFFYNYYLRPAPSTCRRCHKTCDSVSCEPNKRCRMTDGYPQCVCRPRCDPAVKSRGRLCGSDGRKYRNYCALQRANCVTQKQTRVEYYGRCRRSCKLVQCERGQRCLEDQNGLPHCISCRTTCDLDIPDNPRNYLCAVDGRTYKNTCELQAEICRRGKSVRLAYSGSCREKSSCALTTCLQGSTCLSHHLTRQPVCVDCRARCAASPRMRICGTDGRTYNSYCDMKKIGCYLGQYISTKRNGPCKRKDRHNHKVNGQDSNSRILLAADNHIQLQHPATTTSSSRRHRRRKGKHKSLAGLANKQQNIARNPHGRSNATGKTKKRKRKFRHRARRLKAS